MDQQQLIAQQDAIRPWRQFIYGAAAAIDQTLANADGTVSSGPNSNYGYGGNGTTVPGVTVNNGNVTLSPTALIVGFGLLMLLK